MDVPKQAPYGEFCGFFPKKFDFGADQDWFASGNFCGAAILEGWQGEAASGLMGNLDKAITGLQFSETDEQLFYLGASLWIAGNEIDALEALRRSSFPAAEHLVKLICKPQINVAAMSVWEDEDFQDPKFRVQKTGLSRTRMDETGQRIPDNRVLENPFLSVTEALSYEPDFFFAHMIEWHALPFDLHQLRCPTFGTTSDIDLHIQNNAPWMPAFDEVITAGPEEWGKARMLRSGPTCIFPKLFGLDAELLRPLNQYERDIDLFISGTTFSPYHPDKAALMRELMLADGLQIRAINGFLDPQKYHDEMARSKIAFTYVRHPGSMPSRGIDALGCGCAVLVQKGSALTLYGDHNEGIYTYHPGQLVTGLQALVQDWPRVSSQARRGAELMRRDFSKEKCISQFLRFLTVRTALLGSARYRQAPSEPHQKRVVASKGWLYPATVNYRMLAHNTAEAQAKESESPAPENPINAAREMDLYLTHDLPELKKRSLLIDEGALLNDLEDQLKSNAGNVYDHGIAKHPRSLVLAFNRIRHHLHMGRPENVPEILVAIRNVIDNPNKFDPVQATEDIGPWDYHNSCFNYRAYLDILTDGLTQNSVDHHALADLIHASLFHYLAQYTGEVSQLEQAVKLDPDFAHYRYSLARGYLLRGAPGDYESAADLFLSLFQQNQLASPAGKMLAKLHHQGIVNDEDWTPIEAQIRKLQHMTFDSAGACEPLNDQQLVFPPNTNHLPLFKDPFSKEHFPPAGLPQSAHLACSTGRNAGRQRILLISFECGDWENAKGWTYNGFCAFEDALRAHDVKHFTLPVTGGVPSSHPSAWLRQADLFTHGQSFDQAWIWLTHSELDSDFIEWFKSIAPIRVGIVMESLEHTDAELACFPDLAGRREKVLSDLESCTHTLLFDEDDANAINDQTQIKALWCPPIVNWRDVSPECPTVPVQPATFRGNCYNTERQQILDHLCQAGLLNKPDSVNEPDHLVTDFDELQMQFIKLLAKYPVADPNWRIEYLSKHRTLRRQLNNAWTADLRNSFAQVNLPSIFKSYAGRVVESMAAGRPVISWKPPRERTQALFKPGEEILWFDRDDPEALARQIRFLQKHPEQAQAIAERARQKVLRYHTAETRVRQILDWIADGTLPDYGEHTDLSTETHQPQTDMNEPSHPQIDTLEAALEHAETCNDSDDRPGAIQALERAVELGDHHPVLLRALGTQQYLAGNHDAATELFREFTENCPNDATGHVQFALATYHAGDELGCEVALQQALLLEANHPEALKLSADLDVRHKRYDKAREKYDLIAETGGITVDALHALAFCQFKTGETDRAEDTYQQLLAFNSDDELAQANLKTIAKLQQPESGQPETGPAETNLEQADFFQQAGNPEAALAELEQAVNRDPHNAGLREALGSLLYQQDRTEEARRQFRRLIELQPQCAMAYTRLAMTSYATERFDEFESALGLAMELDPELPEMLHFFGKVNLDQGRYYEAGRVFSKLMELEPDHPDNLLALGVCLYHGNQPEAAQQTFERVLQLDPTNPLAQENLTALANNDSEALTAIAEQSALPTETPNVAVEEEEPLSHRTLKSAQTALEQGDPQRAIDLLQDVLIEHPHEVPILNALANLLQQAGLNAEAARHFQQLALLEPENIAPRLQAATAALLSGEIDVFEINMEKALELDAQNPHGLKLLATANFKAGKYREAADIYHQALSGLPEDIEIVLALGVCFHHLQSPDTARDCFKRALEIDPQNELAAENLKALSSEPATETDEKSGANSQVSAKVLRELREANPSTESNNGSNLELPPVALLGNLDRAQALLAEGRHMESWQETLQALELRPFHPEAYLHLAEVALDAGDYAQAMICLGRLTTLTPEWEVPRQALDTLRQGSVPENSATMDWPALPEVPESPRLTVCMIVKNEEQFIAQALQSVQPHADQIVVLDTGSTDRTVAIAKQHGAEAHHFEWCDDFAAARNAALEHARGDWVLIIDADEIVPSDEAHHLSTDLAQTNMLGYRLPLYNKILNADGTDETADGQCHVPRLFRNAPSLHFVGRVHEQVYSSVLARQLDWQMDSAIGHTTLHHFGYTPEIKDKQDKVKRNLRLLEKAVAEEPAEPTLLMNYALDLFNDGQFEAALEKDRQAFSLLSEKASANVLPEIRERLVSVFCYHLLQAELYEELAEVAASPLSRDCGPTASIHYVHGLALLKLGRPAEAIAPFRDCILKREEPVYTARFKGVENHGPHHLLADCYAQTGRTEEARGEYEEALKLSPEATIVRWGYARFLTEQDLSDEAIQLLFGAIENGSIDSRLWALGCHIVNGHLNDTEVAQRWTECAIDADPHDAEIRKQRGVALLTVSRFQEAEEFFAKTPLHPLNEGARILCQVATGQTPHLSDPDKEILISTAFMEWFRRLVERGQEPAARAVAEQHSQLEDALPTAAEMLRSMMVADG